MKRILNHINFLVYKVSYKGNEDQLKFKKTQETVERFRKKIN